MNIGIVCYASVGGSGVVVTALALCAGALIGLIKIAPPLPDVLM